MHVVFTRTYLFFALLVLPLALRAELVLHPTGAQDEVRAVFSGDISHADVARARELGGLLKSGKRKLAGNAVGFASAGGDFDASMQLGRLLRELGLSTVVAKDAQCMSACVFAFMGGERRAVEGRLGVHRPWFPVAKDFPDRQSKYRSVQKTLRAYIDEMDFPDSLYETVMAVPPESMHFLTPAELKRFYLVGISPSSEDLADAATARRLGLGLYDYLKLKAQSIAAGRPLHSANCTGAFCPAITASQGASNCAGSPSAQALGNVACGAALEPSW